MYSVILFHSSNDAVSATKALAKLDIKHKLTQSPKHLKSSCERAIIIDTKDILKAKEILGQEKVTFDRIESILDVVDK